MHQTDTIKSNARFAIEDSSSDPLIQQINVLKQKLYQIGARRVITSNMADAL
jgi:hypothetical protein